MVFSKEWYKYNKHPMLGKRHSKESIEKNRLKHLGMKKPLKAYSFGCGEKNINYGKHLSKDIRKKLSDSHIGILSKEKHPKWKGGISPLNLIIRGSARYKEWRIAVFERDNYTCKKCSSNKNLEADHIRPFANFPELRFDVNNGRTLCDDCHKQITFGDKN